MTDLNHVVVIGRLTRGVTDSGKDFGYLPDGTPKANVSVAVNRSAKKNGGYADEVSFFDVTIFGKIAEGLKPYLVKGTQVAVQGSLRQDRWEKDGQKFSRIYIVADSVQLLGGTGRKEGSEPFARNDSEAERNQHDSSGEAYPEDIPF